MNNKIENIVVIQTAFIGDAILTLPFLQQLRLKYSSANIVVITNPQNYELFSSSNSVDKAVIFDKRGKNRSIIGVKRFADSLNSIKYDILFCLHRSSRSTLLSSLINAQAKIGFENSSLKYLFDKLIPYAYKDHEVKRNLNFLDNRLTDWKILPEIEIKTESKHNVDDLCKDMVLNNIIAFAPGSIWETKKYPWDYYKRVILQLVNNYNVVLIGSNDDYKFINENSETDFLKRIINFCGKLSVVETIYFLRKCQLLVANDSAPTHMGIAANTKVLTLYCSTVPEFGFYPYNEKSSYLGVELECKPCGIHGYHICPRKDFKCGNELSPEMVLEKIHKMLNEKS